MARISEIEEEGGCVVERREAKRRGAGTDPGGAVGMLAER
jgi:hypothetical protein